TVADAISPSYFVAFAAVQLGFFRQEGVITRSAGRTARGLGAQDQPRYDETNVPAAPLPAKRSRRNGAGLTRGVSRTMRAAIIAPTAGHSLKPWPDMPAAMKNPPRGDSSRIGIQS